MKSGWCFKDDFLIQVIHILVYMKILHNDKRYLIFKIFFYLESIIQILQKSGNSWVAHSVLRSKRIKLLKNLKGRNKENDLFLVLRFTLDVIYIHSMFYYHIPYTLLIRHVSNILPHIIHMISRNDSAAIFIIHAVTMMLFSTFLNKYLNDSWTLLKDLSL